MGLSAGGNTVTIGRAAAEAVLAGPAPVDALAAGRRFGAWLRAQPAPPRFAVVHAFSTHNFLLRYWLAASGLDPDQDISAVVIPPEHVAQALADGSIAGFCAGAPWGELAAQRGSGRLLLGTSAIWGCHPEKCLVVGANWAAANPGPLQALLRGLLRAQRLCDQPATAAEVAAMLAGPPLALPLAPTRACLAGGARGGTRSLPRWCRMVPVAVARQVVPGPDAPLGVVARRRRSRSRSAHRVSAGFARPGRGR